MMKPEISIIIPVYEVEKYIEKCINSLQEQTYKNFEALIINDGTKDNSINIAKEIVSNDSRFIFFDKDNGGLSDARNYGIERSKGKYICFLDSDDYYDKDFLKIMYNKIVEEKSDIVICDIVLVNENYEKIRDQKNIYQYSISGKEALLDMSILNMAQNKLYKKELFDDIKYPVGYYYEDRATTYRLFYKSNKISFVNEILFYYLQRTNSITRGLNQQKLSDPLKILEEIKEFLFENNIYERYREKYIQNYLLTILSSSVQIADFSLNYSKDINSYLKQINNKIFSFKNIYLLRDNPKKMLALYLLKFNKNLFKILAKKEKKI
jgi:glycosyltransferase involved in cell wall biosynthesis